LATCGFCDLAARSAAARSTPFIFGQGDVQDDDIWRELDCHPQRRSAIARLAEYSRDRC
jgi:hypothetical protein